MQARSTIQCIELFHLLFLRALEVHLDRSAYVVKGGVNLRAWFGSARYSEDLDLDALRLTRNALEDKVDKALGGRPLGLLLGAQGLELTRITKPKQTETTQRWKLELRARGADLPFHTRVEFSRRGVTEPHLLEPALAEVVKPYGILAPAAQHYTAAAAVRQKIGALAGRAEIQARDIWDLEHLFRVASADARPLTAALARAVPVAIERTFEMPFDAFRAQVVSFLAPEQQPLHDDPVAWDRIRERVVAELTSLLP